MRPIMKTIECHDHVVTVILLCISVHTHTHPQKKI